MHRVREWIAQRYPRPTVDQEWLGDCTAWIASEFGLDPDTNFDPFIQHVEAQLLQSNLADSTVPGSGIDPLLFASNPPRPRNARRPVVPRQKKTTGPTPLLVEIKGITDIAHSAFNLLNTHQTRLDRADLGLAHEENADEDEGPVPKFPRGMLRLELWDGSTTFPAIEFRSLPQLELGTTPLGYKMLLKSTPIRNSIAFLEPSNVVLKGYRTEDHDVNSDQVFLGSLRKRLGRPDPPPEVPIEPQPNLPVQPAPQHQAPPVVRPQLPPAVDDMYVDDDVDPDVLREMVIQMDKSIAMQDNHQSSIRVPPPPSKEQHPAKSPVASSSRKAAPTAKASPYFGAHASGSKPFPDIGLSPRPAPLPSLEPDFDFTWDDDDIDISDLPAKASKYGASAKPLPSAQSAKRPPSPDPYDDAFDMDVDESFFEQVGMIEQVALGTAANKGKGKGKDTTQSSTLHSRTSAADRKTLSGSAPGTKPSMSPSGAERNTRTSSGTKRAASASSMSASTETHTAPSTQSSGRRIPRDPSLIIISSSEEEGPRRGHGAFKPLDIVRRRTQKKRGDDMVDDDVIDISD